MSERLMLEYVLNAAWQLPLVTAAAWLLLKAVRPGPLGEHRLWLAVLATCILLPLHGMDRVTQQPLAPSQPAFSPYQAAAIPTVPVTNDDPATIDSLPPAAPSPRPSAWHLRIAPLNLSATAVRTGACIYASIMLFALLRLTRGWLSARRLLSRSTDYAMNEAEAALWRELGQRLHTTLPPVRTSAFIASPVVLGIVNPVLLLPEGFAQCPEPEQRAALAHELAHILRRDTLVHAICQLAALPLVWHPLLEAVQRQVARTREMVCDDLAARTMHTGTADERVAYARSLLSLAQRMLHRGAPRFAGEGMQLFRNNKLEERVMRLTEARQPLSVPQAWARWTGGLVTMGAAILAAGMFHLTPVNAQQAAEAPMSRPDAPLVPTASALAPAPAPSPIQEAAPTPAPNPAPAPPAPALPAVPPLPALPPMSAPMPPSLPAMAPIAPLPALPPMPPVTISRDLGEVGEIGDDADLRGPRIIEDQHGKHMLLKDGKYTHRWTAQDGSPFELRNNQAGEPTPQQKLDAEAEYRRAFDRAQKSLDKLGMKLNSPEWKMQMDHINSGELARQIADAQKQSQIAIAKLNSPEWKAQWEKSQKDMAEQLAKINSTEWKLQTQKQIDEAMKNIPADLELKGAEADRQAALLASPELKKRLNDAQKQLDEAMKNIPIELDLKAAEVDRQAADVDRQAALLNSPELKKQLDDAQKQLDAASKQMAEAAQAYARVQKQLQEKQAQLNKSKQK